MISCAARGRLALAQGGGPHGFAEQFDPAQPAAHSALRGGGDARAPSTCGSGSHMRSSIPTSVSRTSMDWTVPLQSDHSFGQAETEGEVLEIAWARHHDGVCRVVCKGDCRFFPGWRVRPAKDRRLPVIAQGAVQRLSGATPPLPWPGQFCGWLAPLVRSCSCQLVGPFERPICTCRGLLLRAIGRDPIGIVLGRDVGLRTGMVEGGVDDTRRDALGDERAQRCLTRTACELDPMRVPCLSVLRRGDGPRSTILLVPRHARPCGASAHRRCTGSRIRPVVEQWEARACTLSRWRYIR